MDGSNAASYIRGFPRKEESLLLGGLWCHHTRSICDNTSWFFNAKVLEHGCTLFNRSWNVGFNGLTSVPNNPDNSYYVHMCVRRMKTVDIYIYHSQIWDSKLPWATTIAARCTILSPGSLALGMVLSPA